MRLYPFEPATTPPPSDFLVRREALQAVGGFEEEFRGICQLYDDQAFLVKMYLSGSISYRARNGTGIAFILTHVTQPSQEAATNDSVRAFFFQWFESYLRRQGIGDPDIWRILASAAPAARMQLRTDGGSVAKLSYSANDPEWVRIAIERAATCTSPDIQSNRPYYALRASHHYRVQLQAKADRLRDIAIGAATAHAPWTSLGLYQRIELTQGWQSFELEFVATMDDDRARIHFDVGASEGSVELTALHVCVLPGGEPVEPSLSPIYRV